MPGSHYRITWRDAQSGEFVTLRARTIRDSTLGLTFVAVSDLLFDTTGPLVNPAEESLAKRYASTKTLHLNLHAIVAIEEVGEDHAGLTFERDRSNLLVFPPKP